MDRIEQIANTQTQMAKDIAVLQTQMVENTTVTVQVRDILAGFRTFASLAKWATAIAASGAGIAAAFKGMPK